MHVCSHTIETTAALDRVWSCIANPERWVEWQALLTRVHFSGPLSPMARGVLELASSRRSFYIERISPHCELVWVVRGFLCQARITQRIAPCTLGTRLTHQVEVSGVGTLLDPYFRRSRLRASVPESARRLAEAAGKLKG